MYWYIWYARIIYNIHMPVFFVSDSQGWSSTVPSRIHLWQWRRCDPARSLGNKELWLRKMNWPQIRPSKRPQPNACYATVFHSYRNMYVSAWWFQHVLTHQKKRHLNQPCQVWLNDNNSLNPARTYGGYGGQKWDMLANDWSFCQIYKWRFPK